MAGMDCFFGLGTSQATLKNPMALDAPLRKLDRNPELLNWT